jgi:hypothetical protein
VPAAFSGVVAVAAEVNTGARFGIGGAGVSLPPHAARSSRESKGIERPNIAASRSINPLSEARPVGAPRSSGAGALVADDVTGERQALTALGLAAELFVDLPNRAAAGPRLGTNLCFPQRVAHANDHGLCLILANRIDLRMIISNTKLLQAIRVSEKLNPNS